MQAMKLSTQDIKKILVFGHSNIGDVCYNLVVVDPLRRAFAQARISFVTSARAKDAAGLACGVDEVIVFDKQGRHRGIKGYLRLIAQIRARQYDLAVILRGQSHYFFGIPRVVAPRLFFAPSITDHIAYEHLRLLAGIGVSDKEPQFKFCFTEEEQSRTRTLISSGQTGERLRIGIMPFAAWRSKCWSVEKWNEIIVWLMNEYQAQVFVLGKIGTHVWDEEFARRLHPEAISLINKCTLRESVCVVSMMQVFAGVDSSLLHFSGSMRIPTVSLFGPTNAVSYYPLFCKDLMVRTTYDAVCVPCFRQRRVASCGVSDAPAACMLHISVDEVKEKLRLAMAKLGTRN